MAAIEIITIVAFGITLLAPTFKQPQQDGTFWSWIADHFND